MGTQAPLPKWAKELCYEDRAMSSSWKPSTPTMKFHTRERFTAFHFHTLGYR